MIVIFVPHTKKNVMCIWKYKRGQIGELARYFSTILMFACIWLMDQAIFTYSFYNWTIFFLCIIFIDILWFHITLSKYRYRDIMYKTPKNPKSFIIYFDNIFSLQMLCFVCFAFYCPCVSKQSKLNLYHFNWISEKYNSRYSAHNTLISLE